MVEEQIPVLANNYYSNLNWKTPSSSIGVWTTDGACPDFLTQDMPLMPDPACRNHIDKSAVNNIKIKNNVLILYSMSPKTY